MAVRTASFLPRAGSVLGLRARLEEASVHWAGIEMRSSVCRERLPSLCLAERLVKVQAAFSYGGSSAGRHSTEHTYKVVDPGIKQVLPSKSQFALLRGFAPLCAKCPLTSWASSAKWG